MGCTNEACANKLEERSPADEMEKKLRGGVKYRAMFLSLLKVIVRAVGMGENTAQTLVGSA